MIRLGFFIFILGIGLSIVCGAKLPEGGDSFPDTLGFFILFVILTVGGLVLWRYGLYKEVSLKREAMKESRSEDDKSSPKELLSAMKLEVIKVINNFEELSSEKVTDSLDSIITNLSLPFGEAKDELFLAFGLEKGSKVLISFSYAERLMNRAYSASSDGCLVECLYSLKESLAGIEETEKVMAI